MRRGSVTVEAALVFPLILLVLLGLLRLGISMSGKVQDLSDGLVIQEEITSPTLPPEKVLRLKWLGIQLIEE